MKNVDIIDGIDNCLGLANDFMIRDKGRNLNEGERAVFNKFWDALKHLESILEGNDPDEVYEETEFDFTEDYEEE